MQNQNRQSRRGHTDKLKRRLGLDTGTPPVPISLIVALVELCLKDLTAFLEESEGFREDAVRGF